MQPPADRAAMHRHAMRGGQFGHDLVQRQIPLERQPIAQPAAVRGQLALGMITLRLRRKPAARALEDHHVVHKARRNPKVPRCLAMPMTLFDKRDDPAPQLDRMWLAHSDPPYLAGTMNHKPLNKGILNQPNGDTL